MRGRPRLVRLLIFLGAVAGTAGIACTAPNPRFTVVTDTGPRDAWSEPSGLDLHAEALHDSGFDAEAVDAAASDADAATDDGDSATDGGGPTTDAPTPPDAGNPPSDARTAGLLAHWAFDQPPASGSATLTDSFGNTAALRGSISWSDDRPPRVTGDRSLAFAGGHVEVTLVPSQQPTSTGPKTVALWFKSTDPGTTLHTLIALYNRSKQADVGLQLGIGATKIEGWPFGRSFRYLSITTATPRAWHHLAYTFAAGTHILYVDGLESDRSTTWETKTGTLDVVRLGTWDETAAPTFYLGLMRDLRIYNEALGAAEIRSLAGLPP